MAVTFVDVDQLMNYTEAAGTQGLLAGAHYFQEEHQKRIGIQFPPHSRPGEYLRKMTGHGQMNFLIEKFDPRTVRIGYSAAFPFPYMTYWEFNLDATKKRKNFVETFADVKDEVFKRVNTVAKAATIAFLRSKRS